MLVFKCLTNKYKQNSGHVEGSPDRARGRSKKTIKRMKEPRKVRIIHSDGPFRVVKYRRNDPCPCGSGKKSKNCCSPDSKYYVKKTK